MRSVTRFEANLLQLLWFFLHREPSERALPLLENRCDAPRCLNRNAVHLIQDALAKGCVFLLARQGGWRRERSCAANELSRAGYGNGTPPAELGLTFSAHTLRFLIWITAHRPGDTKYLLSVPEDELTLGDRLLFYFAHERLRSVADGLDARTLRSQQPFLNHALCWLAFPEDFTATPAEARPNFTSWTNGTGAYLLEAMQPELTRRWIEVESNKERLVDPQAMRRFGSGAGARVDRVSRCDRAGGPKGFWRISCYMRLRPF